MPRNKWKITLPGSTDGKYFHMKFRSITVKDAKTLLVMKDIKNPAGFDEAATSSKIHVMAGERVPDSVAAKTRDKNIVEPEERKVFAGTPILENKLGLEAYMKKRDVAHKVKEGENGALWGNHPNDFAFAKSLGLNTGNMEEEEDDARDAKIRKLEDDLEFLKSSTRKVCDDSPDSPIVKNLLSVLNSVNSDEEEDEEDIYEKNDE